MHQFRNSRIVMLVVIVILTLSCQVLSPAPAEPTETPEPEEMVTPTTAPTEVIPTDTPLALTPTPIETQQPTELATGSPTEIPPPECTVVSPGLNLRSGPGVGYRPVIRTLPNNTTLIPIGYSPVAVPADGSWVQVQEPAENDTGWVNASQEFIECTIDVSTLPVVTVPPPPPPAPPSVGSSAREGTDVPENWEWDYIFNNAYLVRLVLWDAGNGGKQDGDGIENVQFQVANPEGVQVWGSTEDTAKYCIFGGGEPDCNPWVLENYFFRWGAGGPIVQEGIHFLTINAESSAGEFGTWFNIEFSVDLPY